MSGTGQFYIGDTHIVFATNGHAGGTVSEIQYTLGGMAFTNPTAWTSLFDALRDGARKDVALCRFLADAAPRHTLDVHSVAAGETAAHNLDYLPERAPDGYAYAHCQTCGWTSRPFAVGELDAFGPVPVYLESDTARSRALEHAQRVHSDGYAL